MRKLAFLITFLCSFQAFSQPAFKVSGSVKDAKGNPIPGAGVFVSNYKIAAVTNAEGSFSLGTLAPGNYDILFQMIGFLPGKANITVGKQPVILKMTLSEGTTAIEEVVIKPDPNRKKFMQFFLDGFVGHTPNASNFKLLNPTALIFDYDKETNILHASAEAFLLLDNPALGYKIRYLLDDFQYDFKNNLIYYEGHPSYEEMEGNVSVQRKRQITRERAYLGSSQHFLKALVANSAEKEGFVIYKIRHVPNKERPADSLINLNVERFSKDKEGKRVPLVFMSDSLNFWLRKKSIPKSIAVMEKGTVRPDTLVHTDKLNRKYLNFTDELVVVYTLEKESNDFLESGFRLYRYSHEMVPGQLSQLKPLKLPIYLNSIGSVSDPSSTLFSGFWAYEKVADQVPLEYLPSAVPVVKP